MAFAAKAQTTKATRATNAPETKAAAYCVHARTDNIIMVIKPNGTMLTRKLKFRDGKQLLVNGTIVEKNGTKKILQNGVCLDKDGNISDAKEYGDNN
jgi:hypothetical protein